MANGSTADKARKARNKAEDAKYYGGDSRSLANKIAKTATGKDLTYQEEQRAGRIIQNRRINDTARTAARATFIEGRTAKKAAAKRGVKCWGSCCSEPARCFSSPSFPTRRRTFLLGSFSASRAQRKR